MGVECCQLRDSSAGHFLNVSQMPSPPFVTTPGVSELGLPLRDYHKPRAESPGPGYQLTQVLERLPSQGGRETERKRRKRERRRESAENAFAGSAWEASSPQQEGPILMTPPPPQGPNSTPSHGESGLHRCFRGQGHSRPVAPGLCLLPSPT